jgi:hypothetical protein
MKMKHVLWIVAGAVAVIAMAAGVAVIINRYLNHKKAVDYIECDCEPDSDFLDDIE